jgi:hypothetical protein
MKPAKPAGPGTIAVVSVVAICFVAVGPIIAAPDDPPANLLAGPDVGEPSLERTLVEREMDGGVRTLAAPPAIMALDLIELDAPARERVDELLRGRAALMETLVLENLELLGQIETVFAVGRPVEKLNLLREGLQALGPVRRWGRLDRRIAEVLPRERRAEFRQHISEYERERYEAAREAGELDNAYAYRMMRYWEDIAWEIERAGERVLVEDENGDAWLRLLAERLDLTPDQQGEIRAMGERFFFETKGRPSKEDEARLIAQIRTVMTLEQKWKFTALMLRGELEPGKQTD